jgi:hypothetical protein
MIAAAAPAERSWQQILNSLVYDINVAADEPGPEVFCGSPDRLLNPSADRSSVFGLNTKNYIIYIPFIKRVSTWQNAM